MSLILLSAAWVAPISTAQTSDPEPKKLETEPQKRVEPDKNAQVDRDLDAFFEKADEEAKDGPTCHAPVKPIA